MLTPLITPGHIAAACLAISLAAAGSAGAGDDGKPTREAFIREVLDARPTPVTAKFDDYTPGSYHVGPEDLLKGVVELATRSGPPTSPCSSRAAGSPGELAGDAPTPGSPARRPSPPPSSSRGRTGW